MIEVFVWIMLVLYVLKFLVTLYQLGESPDNSVRLVLSLNQARLKILLSLGFSIWAGYLLFNL